MNHNYEHTQAIEPYEPYDGSNSVSDSQDTHKLVPLHYKCRGSVPHSTQYNKDLSSATQHTVKGSDEVLHCTERGVQSWSDAHQHF